MKPGRLYLLFLLFASFMVSNSCSQTTTANPPVTDVFAGSSPCDPAIKKMISIPAGDSCEFIKWDLSLSRIQMDSGNFQLKILYGESQPNTNGFKGGGKQLVVTGTYHYGRPATTGSKGFYLIGKKLPNPILLVELDNNILHFADTSKKLLVGNGGWGYVLNRVLQ